MAEEAATAAGPRASPLSARAAGHIVVAYAVFSALWILLSDRLIAWAFTNPDWLTLVSIMKGWLFVLVTSALLLVLLRRLVDGRPAGLQLRAGPQLSGVAFAPVALVVAISAGFGIAYTLAKHRDTEVARLQAIADLKVAQISDWLRDREEQARFVQGSNGFTEQYYRWHSAGDPAAGEQLLSYLAQLRWSRGFSEVMLLDPEGRYLWSTAGAAGEMAPALKSTAQRAAQDGKVHRVGPYLDAGGRPRLDYVAAFHPALNAAPIVVLRTDPSDWLLAALQAWPVPSESGETLIFRREGDAVVYLNDLRYRPGSMVRLDAAMNDGELLAAQVLRGEVRLGESVAGRDYREVPVIGVARNIEGTDWFLVAKMDRRELLGHAAADILWIALASVLVLALFHFGMSLLHQREQLLLATGIQQSQTERLRALGLLAAIADGSEDAIFAKDREGRYTLCNRAASRLVGKAAEEVVGLDDRDLFPAGQAEMLMARDRQLIAENRMQSVEEVLTTADGQRVFLATKGPLLDADGKVVGVFGIARDITRRQEAELALRESEARFRALVEHALAGIYIIQDGIFRYVNPCLAQILGYDSPESVIDRLTVAEFAAPQDRAVVEASIKARLEGFITEAHYTLTALRRNGEPVELEVHGCALNYRGRPAVIGMLLDISARKAGEEALRRQAEELGRRNAELERFNRAMVGRELDMLALKEQINDLSQALGREPPFGLAFVDAGTPASKSVEERA